MNSPHHELPRPASTARGPDRARAFVEAHADFVFRSLRRLGLAPAAAEDAAQQVFITALAKLDTIEPGKEKGFLFGVLSNVALHAKRSFARGREDLVHDTSNPHLPEDEGPGPESQMLANEARAVLDQIMAQMDPELREVFMLAELEEMTMADIAVALGIPAGTVASRLRRARAWFDDAATAIQRSES